MANSNCDCYFECDVNLPLKGVPLETKLYLLDLVHNEGGPQVSGYKTRWIHHMCNENPEMLGCTVSEKRKRVKMLMDRWKRSKNWPALRKSIIQLGEDSLVKTKCSETLIPPLTESSSMQQNEAPKLKRIKAPSIKTPSTKHTPALKIEKTFDDMASVTSPLKLVRSKAATKKDHFETYLADFDNEDQHGEYLIGLCTDENVGTDLASFVLICRPNTHPDDLEHLKATVTGGGLIEIVGPAKSKSHIEHSAKWLGALEKNASTFKADKLVTVLKSMVTKFKRVKRLKTTQIKFDRSGFTLSNEYFGGDHDEGLLQLLPVPYSYEMSIKNGGKRHVTEVMCVWRAYNHWVFAASGRGGRRNK